MHEQRLFASKTYQSFVTRGQILHDLRVQTNILTIEQTLNYLITLLLIMVPLENETFSRSTTTKNEGLNTCAKVTTEYPLNIYRHTLAVFPISAWVKINRRQKPKLNPFLSQTYQQ